MGDGREVLAKPTGLARPRNIIEKAKQAERSYGQHGGGSELEPPLISFCAQERDVSGGHHQQHRHRDQGPHAGRDHGPAVVGALQGLHVEHPRCHRPQRG